MALTILEGSTFCICDEQGDLNGETEGLFAEDTRFLSRLCLTVNGARPLLLSFGKVEYFSAAFFLRNPIAGGLPQDTLSIVRHRFVGDGMQDRVLVQNQGMEPVSFELALDLGTDFADILSVKEHDFALGDPERAEPLPDPAPCRYDDGDNQFLLEEHDGGGTARTQVILSRRGEVDDRRVVYRLELGPRESWDLRIDILASIDGDSVTPRTAERRFGEEVTRVRESLAAWQLRVPQIRAEWDAIDRAFFQSVSDLASLRMRGAGRTGRMPAAGMPWFMTVFGRDTLITCLQTLLFGPELARTALEVLTELQARDDNPDVDAEPGKIVHELRSGKAALRWFRTYYGTVDATPLYLVLLSEVWRWTDDSAFVRSLKEPALAALRWIDEFGDHDGDGFVEYERRTPRGLENQSWKDSHDSQRFHDGSLATAPIAPVEVQGYVYDAKLRTAEVAREVWRDRPLAERLENEAAALQRRFDEAYWTDARGGY
jgi:glycogen debranching enzyme